mgnify:CR=1 FL=1
MPQSDLATTVVLCGIHRAHEGATRSLELLVLLSEAEREFVRPEEVMHVRKLFAHLPAKIGHFFFNYHQRIMRTLVLHGVAA